MGQWDMHMNRKDSVHRPFIVTCVHAAFIMPHEHRIPVDP